MQTFTNICNSYGYELLEKAFEASGLPIDITHLSDTIKYSNLNVIVVIYMRQDRDTLVNLLAIENFHDLLPHCGIKSIDDAAQLT